MNSYVGLVEAAEGPSARTARRAADASGSTSPYLSHHFAPDLAHELGYEPAIVLGGRHPSAERHGFSYRWLLASLMVGVCGVALMGGAIYVTMQGDTTFAEPAELAAPAEQPQAGPSSARKGDKLVQQAALPTARQVIRAPFTQRAGDREVSRVRPFVRLASSLSLTAGVYSADIPPFNPLRLFSEGGPSVERAAEMPGEMPDADVSMVKRELGQVEIEADARGLSDAEVIAQLQEERSNQVAAGRRPALPIPPQLMLSRTLRTPGEAPIGPLAYAPPSETRFSNIEVRVIPENVTELAKSRAADTREPPIEERILLIRRGETFETVLRGAGATVEQLRTITTGLGGRARLLALPEGQVMQVTIVAGARPSDPRQIVRVSLISDGKIESMAAANDRGVFVPVALAREEDEPRPRRANRAGQADEEEDEEEGTGARLYDSLYETALRHDMPRPLIDEMVRIFAHDMDFQRRVSGGDSLEVIFTDGEDGEGSRTELLYAALSVGGETRRVYRFQAPDDGVIDFFDQNGQSLKKFLVRKPVAGDAEMRSGFGMRYHPILRYSKMHTGIDWANGRVGTPVIAAGHGTVIKAGWDSGYGRRVEIQHANGYVTTYSHLASFGRGVEEGARVRQGQVIGSVGNSGLSTGPHLHYEVIVNGNFVNPMKIRLPRGRELDGRVLAEFRRQRDAIDELHSRAGGARIAQRDTRSN